MKNQTAFLWAILATTLFPSLALAQDSSLLRAQAYGAGGQGIGGQFAGGQGPRAFDPRGGVPSAPSQLPTPTLVLPQNDPRRAGSSVAAAGLQATAERTPPLHLASASWTHQPATPMRVFRKNDIITIRVDEITRVLAEGSSDSRKQTLYEAVLSDWIRLDNFRLRPDPQGFGDPTVATESNSNFRAQSSVESREAMTFSIAAAVVDIRPNGTLLLEARKKIRVNDNLWETALSGSCRIADIAPDNVVLSRDMIDLEILKEDQGHLRDGYKRGWFQRWLDRLQPF